MPSPFRLLGLVAIIPISMLLTVSFFVLFAVRKVETKTLKTFGHVVAALLWVAATVVFLIGLYVVITGKHPLMQMKGQMMHQMMSR